MLKALKRVIAIIWQFKGEALLSVVLGIAAITAGIGLLGTSAYLIASAALRPSIADLQVAIVGVRFFGISRGVFRYFERLVSHSVNLRVLSRLREDFYRRVEPGAPANLTSVRSGDVLHRVMGDLETLENFYVRVVAPLIISVVITIGVSLFIGGYALQLGVIVAFGLFLTGYAQPLAALFVVRPQMEKLTQSKATASATMVELLQGLEDIQAGNAQERFVGFLNDEFARTTRLQNQVTKLNSFNNGLTLIFINLTVLAILWAAIPLVSGGVFSGVSLAVITLVTLSSFEATMPMPAAAHNLAASAIAAQRLYALGQEVEKAVEASPELPAGEPVCVVMEKVDFSYGDGTGLTLADINLQLKSGRHVALVGASGAGKSSLVNLLLGFEQPQAGKISIAGQRPQDLNQELACSIFTVLPQEAYLFDDTLRGNLLLAASGAAEEEMLQAIDKAQLTDWFQALPRGLNTWIGEHGLRMSGGERQRLAIARTLLQERPIVILDEPTTNLDGKTAEKVMNTLFENWGRKGLLLITHDMSFLQRMDEIFVLSGGKIAQRGTFDMLRETKGVFQQLYALELNRLRET